MSERAAVGNASDEGQVREARRRNKSEAELLRLDWHRVLSTGEGQRVIWSLLEHCQMRETPYSVIAIPMAFKVGRQDVGRYIEMQINDARPEAYIEMIQYAARARGERKRPSKKELVEEAVVSEGRAITDTTEDSDDGN